jgi:hypothetical protein
VVLSISFQRWVTLRFLPSLSQKSSQTSPQFTTNTHTRSTPTLLPIGVALSPVIALINHSCIPNAVVVFPSSKSKEGNKMKVIAIRDINPASEVSLLSLCLTDN